MFAGQTADAWRSGRNTGQPEVSSTGNRDRGLDCQA
jgi:hypothetical protein